MYECWEIAAERKFPFYIFHVRVRVYGVGGGRGWHVYSVPSFPFLLVRALEIEIEIEIAMRRRVIERFGCWLNASEGYQD